MKKTLTTVLLFAGMASAWASGLPGGFPDGSYKTSCTNGRMVGNTLHTDCETGAIMDKSSMFWGQRGPNVPEVISATLDNANTCADVENQKGQLRCLRQK